MGVPFSGVSNVVGSAVTIAPARPTGQRRIITNINVDVAAAANVLIDSAGGGMTSFKVYRNFTGEIPGVLGEVNSILFATAASGTASFVSISGYDEEVGESQGLIYANVSEATADGTTVFATIRAPLSTTEVIEIHKVTVLLEAASNQTGTVGYDDDGAGTNFVALVPDQVGDNSYDLGAMEIPAGKYIVLRNDEAAGAGAKDSTGMISGRILKP